MNTTDNYLDLLCDEENYRSLNHNVKEAVFGTFDNVKAMRDNFVNFLANLGRILVGSKLCEKVVKLSNILVHLHRKL